ncbi:hypothetical protein M2132_001815 [Dysgonomonas sp. PH5-45]|uniref:hypothetical protein n=1 Tax=unclassified Dysgonomonas TaxID=2630389 RepID=UPI002474E3D9|nr:MULTISPECIES: hypothetical protein [unclassified Dysgonomonas]MDH6355472.1 hypothetical protein [Dysgonomonas sp. PH5-45]MDH6388368.1 hypothetical protein [Dysgonomonas sp. PH5-37]
MNIVRLPAEGLSADYGDIILDSVTGTVESIINIDGTEILHEVYYPDVSGMVYIRDIGSLAMTYDSVQDINLDNGLDGSRVRLDITLQEGEQTESFQVYIYRCDAETRGTLSVPLLKQQPLSRLSKKTTGVGRREFISFYGPGQISANVIYSDTKTDQTKIILLGTIAHDDGNQYKYDVSPVIIASLCGISEADIASYSVYKSESDMIRFVMDHRSFLNKTTFLFRNIFGAQEAFTCIGDANAEKKWTRSYGNINRRQKQISRDLANTITVNTGYISIKSTEIIEDLLNSQSICLLEDGQLRDISIIEESFKVTSRRDELIAVEFKYRYSSNNQMQFRKPANTQRVFDFTFDSSFN